MLVRLAYPNKVVAIEDRVIVACTGAVGLSQRFIEQVAAAHKERLFMGDCSTCVTNIAGRTCRAFDQSGTPRTTMQGYGFGALVAAPFGAAAFELVEFDVITLQPEVKRQPLHAASLGSGQVLADPFLAFVKRVLWKNEMPTVEHALIGVYWTLSHTCELAPGGVGRPLQIGVLKRAEKGRWTVNVFDEPDLQQMAQHVAAIEQRIGTYTEEMLATAVSSAPPIPPPQN
jgi:hypothetical protein